MKVCGSSARRWGSGLAALVVVFAAAVAWAAPASEAKATLTPERILGSLNQALAWYRQARVAMQSVDDGSGFADTREDSFETETVELSDIVDRIGGGDAFAAGVLHALIRDGEDIAQAARTGLALAALKHFVPGDNAPFTQADIDKFLEGERDVRR